MQQAVHISNAPSHCTATHCNTLQHAATHCNTLQYDTVGNMLPPAALMRAAIVLQLTATHCNTLQHAATYGITTLCGIRCRGSNACSHCTATHCNTLQHTATRCNTLPPAALMCAAIVLQHTATHCNTLQHTAPCGSNVRSHCQFNAVSFMLSSVHYTSTQTCI